MVKLGLRFFLVASMTCAAASRPVSAAEVAIEDARFDNVNYGDQCLIIHLSLKGDIAQGDTDKLAAMIDKIDQYVVGKNSACYLNDAAADRLIYVDLQSYGGSYDEGWKLAKLISDQERIASTYIGQDSYCYSACAIAFLGGSVPSAEGTIAMRRVIHPSAKLGFHAPFPLLPEGSYDAATVKGFFLDAFTVASNFMNDAQSLGISREVAQLLLQPTPDAFYEINTSGRAMLTNVSVSAAPFNFSIVDEDGSGLIEITPAHLMNLCYNNQILKKSGETTSIVNFRSWRQESNVKPFTSIKTVASYFTRTEIPIDAVVVPVDDLAEGEILSCVSVVANVVSENKRENGLNFACLAFANGDSDLADKIKTEGLNWLTSGATDRCSTSSKLALLPWDTALSNVPDEFLSD